MLFVALTLIVSLRASPVLADDQDDAERAAVVFVSRLTDGSLPQIYADLTTAQFRSTIPQDRFEQTVGVLEFNSEGRKGALSWSGRSDFAGPDRKGG